MPSPRYDDNMLRRAAEACRNAQKQMDGQRDWFDWVPQHLDQLAVRVPTQRLEDYVETGR